MRKLSAIILSIALLLDCSVFAASAQAAPAVSRVVTTFYGPGARGFHWYTDIKAESKVVVNGESSTGKSTWFMGAWAHCVVVDGLQPGMQYSYRIGDHEGTFRTDPGRGVPMNFIVGGDTQGTARDHFRLSANIFKSAFRTYPDAGFYSILGDLTQNSANKEWDMFFEEMEGVNAGSALMPVTGNHDGVFKFGRMRNTFTLPEQYSCTNSSGVYYSFDYGDAHIAVLNTNDWLHVGESQLNWLVNDMNATGARWKILMAHKPIYFHNEVSPDCMALRRALGPVCDTLGIDLVLSGHKHSYSRSAPLKGHGTADYERCEDSLFTDPDGTIYVMPGTAGQIGGHGPTFANIEIDGDTLKYRASLYDPETDTAKLRDEFTIKKTQPNPPAESHAELPTDPLRTLPSQFYSVAARLAAVVVVDYILGGLLVRLLQDIF
jgi:hypothetical protein